MQRRGKGGMGEESGSGAARFQKGKERGGRVEIVGSGGVTCGSAAEREREREQLGRRGKELTSGPRLSVRERGKGEKGRLAGWLGRGPGRRARGGGKIWAKNRKGGRGKRSFFSFLFSKKIFQTLFKMNFEFKFLCSKPLIT